MMPKFGNSSTSERKDLINRFIRLFGSDNIECLLVDREFVGANWLEYLNKLGIEYYIRIRESFWVEIPGNGHLVKAFWLYDIDKFNQCCKFLSCT
jgi:hypothetical protein